MRRSRSRVLMAMAAFLFAGLSEACAGSPADWLHLPDAAVQGRSLGEWGASWWQWVASFPKDVNPLKDLLGERCAQGQTAPVWMLVGAGAGDPAVERRCSVPGGRDILIPILNTIWWSPGDCPPDDLEQCRIAARQTMDDVSLLEAWLDDQPVDRPEQWRAQSPFFDFAVPPDNIFGLPVRSYTFVTDGFWLMFKPLPAGSHKIRVVGAIGIPERFRLDVTYLLEIQAPTFRRGEVNGDAQVDLGDAISILNHLFVKPGAFDCDDALDTNDDGQLDLGDPIYLLNYMFASGSAPPPPGPGACGEDPTPDALGCARGC